MEIGHDGFRFRYSSVRVLVFKGPGDLVRVFYPKIKTNGIESLTRVVRDVFFVFLAIAPA